MTLKSYQLRANLFILRPVKNTTMNVKATLFSLILTCFSISLTAQTIWAGPKITFNKENNSDWKQPENQDRITDSVWITRGQDKGIFNIYYDSAYSSTTPTDTEWAFGNTSQVAGLVFMPFVAANGSAKAKLDNPMVMHIISEDIYIDVTFKSWGASKSGGFSYERSTPGSAMNLDKVKSSLMSLYPNPASKTIAIRGLEANQHYSIFNSLGAKISSGEASNHTSIDISGLKNGVYQMVLADGTSLRFVKA